MSIGKKRTKSLTTPNKVYYSLQTSILSSAQLSPRSSSNPRITLSTAKHNIEFLANEVKKCKQERKNLVRMEIQARNSGEMLGEKINLLKIQVELVLQQNKRLAIVKKELIEKLKEIKITKKILEEGREKTKVEYKKRLKRLVIRKRLLDESYKKKIHALNVKLQEQKELASLLKENTKLVNTELEVLKQRIYNQIEKHNRTAKEITENMEMLSHLIETT